jgi:malonyl-CoA/methylmalonyl-CoA synthetase
MNLYSLFDRQDLDRRSVFIRQRGRAPITYGETFDAAARVANALAALGLRPGDRVAVQVEKSAEAIFLYLGCLRAGIVFLPLNTAYRLAEIEYFIRDASPSLVVGGSASAVELGKICGNFGVDHLETLNMDGSGSFFERVNRQAAEHRVVNRSNWDLAAMLYTSGTTGRSKGAMLTHGNLASNCRALTTLWEFCDKDVLLHVLPIFHTHGLFVALNVSLCAGSCVLLLSSFNAAQVVRLLPEVTCMMGVPTFYTRLLDEPSLNRQSARNVRLFVSGSAPLLAETHRDWELRTGHAILERYGITETNMNASNPYAGRRKPGTVGLPLPGVEIKIAGGDGWALGRGEVGMIQIRGPNVFTGYWNMPAKTAEEFTKDGYFISGDFGRFDDDGYLSIVGRAKDLIISGGYNVYPKEVENEIDLIPGVLESAVIGLPHPDFGEGVVAIVVPTTEGEVREENIISTLKGRLAGYKLPKKIFYANELPRNTMGKVQKNLLRERYAGEFGR